MTAHIAIVGAGLVGTGWAIVFARAGLPVRVFDSDSDARAVFMDRVHDRLDDLVDAELIDESAATVTERIEMCNDLGSAVVNARYVQESVLERPEIKRSISVEIGKLIDKTTVVGSSSSGIPASAFTENVDHRENFLIAHPVNPPYLAPVVELVPAAWTTDQAISLTSRLMTEVGQAPVHVNREIEGFVLNRLQGVLLREAWALYEAGYASLDDIDKTIRDGLGLRWSFMGPFETIDLNAPGGIADYARRLGPLYRSIAADGRHESEWSNSLIKRVEAERRQSLPSTELASRTRWRDRRLMELAAHKSAMENLVTHARNESVTRESE